MPRPTKNSSLASVLPKMPVKSKSSAYDSSHEQDVGVELLSEEGKLLYNLLSRKLDFLVGEFKLDNARLEECEKENKDLRDCLLYTSPSPRDKRQSRMPSSA